MYLQMATNDDDDAWTKGVSDKQTDKLNTRRIWITSWDVKGGAQDG